MTSKTSTGQEIVFKQYVAHYRPKSFSHRDPAVSCIMTAADDDAAVKQLCFRNRVKVIEEFLSVSIMEVLGRGSYRDVLIYMDPAMDPVARLVKPSNKKEDKPRATHAQQPKKSTPKKPSVDVSTFGEAVTRDMVIYNDNTACTIPNDDSPKK